MCNVVHVCYGSRLAALFNHVLAKHNLVALEVVAEGYAVDAAFGYGYHHVAFTVVLQLDAFKKIALCVLCHADAVGNGYCRAVAPGGIQLGVKVQHRGVRHGLLHHLYGSIVGRNA